MLARRALATVLAGAGLAALACSQDIQPPPVRNLDRPSSIAFACYGDMRINDDDSSHDGDVVVSAQPVESCLARLRGEVPEGQESIEGEPPIIPPRSYAFVLQSAKGTVGVIETETQVVIDSDPLTPGKNSIPIGALPVAVAADRSGCYMMSANAGSCDLGVLDVSSALRIGQSARIARIPIANAAGDLMRARPRTMVGGAQEAAIGLECPSANGPVRPTGVQYIAYPSCHLVAVVDARSGSIVAGIQFDEDGAPLITDGNVSCPQECGDGSIVPTATAAALPGGIDASPIDAGIDAGPAADAGPATTDDSLPRPVALDLGPDGRLYIGAENSPLVTAVELDAAGLPAATVQTRLEGSVGVTALDASHVVEMGGELGTLGGSAGNFEFLYAVASDRTVRVVDLERNLECDAQVDPRFLHDVRDVAAMACMPVGDPATPPRRAGARSPGIHIPRDAVPLDVSFALVSPSMAVGDVAPEAMVGTFAFITTSDGFVYVVNVDDDNYPDFEDDEDLLRATMTLALPHQIRDFIGDRDAVADNCAAAQPDPQFGPRLATPPSLLVSEDRLATDKLHLAPNVRQVMCTAGDDRAAVSELDFGAPVEVRERAYPDWRPIFAEPITITWEGPLSRDQAQTDLDGPPVRNGVVEQLETRVRLRDPNQPFCQIGAEPFDVVTLLGCDPALGDGQCGIGEVCYVHPDSPTTVPSGICMPDGKTDELGGLCREFLITRRQYAARSVHAGEVTLGNRRRVLRTTPIAGCESSAQCQQLAGFETTLSTRFHPIEIAGGDPPASEFRWECAADPTRAPAPDRCLMVCETMADCEPGLACNQGYCIEGVIPPPECVSTVQRYTMRASDAFVVIGDRTGYLHNRIEDAATGECVPDPEASPLLIGRIPLVNPPCTGDGFDAVSPNPCATTVEHAEVHVPFAEEDGDCRAQPDELREREVGAIRFTNPAFTMHLVDTTTTGDAVCIGDRAGTLPEFSIVYPGFQLLMEIVAGFFPMFVQGIEAAYPIGIAPGPDGRMWVLDQGDSSVSTFGRVYTFIPEASSEGFAVIQIL